MVRFNFLVHIFIRLPGIPLLQCGALGKHWNPLLPDIEMLEKKFLGET